MSATPLPGSCGAAASEGPGAAAGPGPDHLHARGRLRCQGRSQMVSGSVKSLGLASRSWSWAGPRLAVRRRAARGNPAGARSPGFKFTSGLESVIGGKLVLGVVLGLVDGNESIKLKNEVCAGRRRDAL